MAKRVDPLTEAALRIRLPDDEESKAIREWWRPQVYSRIRHELSPRGPVTWKRRRWERALLQISDSGSVNSVGRFCDTVNALLSEGNEGLTFEKANEVYLAFSCFKDYLPEWDPSGTYGGDLEADEVSSSEQIPPALWPDCPFRVIPLVDRFRRERREAATGARLAYQAAEEEAWRAYRAAIAPFERTRYRAWCRAADAARHLRDEALAVADCEDERTKAETERTRKEAVAAARRSRNEAVAPAERAFNEAIAPYERILEQAIAVARRAYEQTIAGPELVGMEATSEVVEWDARIRVAQRLAELDRRIEQATGRFRIFDVMQSRDDVIRQKESVKAQLGLPKKRPPRAPERGPETLGSIGKC